MNFELPTLECKRCGHKWHPRSTANPKNCPNPFCKSPYWKIPREDAETGFYTKAEKNAEKILKELDWKPKKMIKNSRDPTRTGAPDFQCSEDRHVEVKKFSRGPGYLTISKAQILRYKQLILEKKKVYLMLFDTNDEFMDMLFFGYDSYWNKERRTKKGGAEKHE